MNMNSKCGIVTCGIVPAILLAGVPLNAASQEPDLFLDDAFDRQRQIAETPDPRAQPSGESSIGFVLKGIYRFGNEYHVSLQVAEGLTHTLIWKTDQPESVSFGSGYELENVKDREIALGLPGGMNCAQSAQSGIACNDQRQMLISFAQTAPIPANQGSGNSDDGEVTVDDNVLQQFGRGAVGGLDELFEAANEGDAEAAEALQQMFGNRGRGGGGRAGGRGRGGE